MSASPKLGRLLESFFHRRLVEQRNATGATLANYRDALRLFIVYVAERDHKAPCQLDITDLDRDTVLDFLNYLEKVRNNSVQTRNTRLTAIRSFFHHVAANDPDSLGIAQQVLTIPIKRATTQAPKHLAKPDLDALLDAPDRKTVRGRRDHVFLLFLVRTGARVSEALGINAADLNLEPSSQVRLQGKGRKQRVIPLAADLTRSLKALCRERGLGRDEQRPIFVSASGNRLTRFGATHIVRRAVKVVALKNPTLLDQRVSPHSFRHTLAMTLLRSGVDLVTIQAWLGHAQLATTHRYAEADVEMMRRSLEQANVSLSTVPRFKPKDTILQLLENRSNM